MLPFVEKSAERRAGTFARRGAAALLLFAVLAAPPTAAADAPPVEADPASAMAPEAWLAESAAGNAEAVSEAQALAGEILSDADAREVGLGEWADRVQEQALTRAGTEAEAALAAAEASANPGGTPLPAEHGAGAISANLPGGRGATVLVFMSLSVPEASWRQWAAEAARAGVPLLLRGPLPGGGMRATIGAAGARLGGADAGIAFDPRLFRLFDITRVPAVVSLPGGVPPCESRGCADDAPPPFDRVTGNTGLAAALEAIAAEGGAGRGAALEHLEKLGARP